jgi:hypothetical protein
MPAAHAAAANSESFDGAKRGLFCLVFSISIWLLHFMKTLWRSIFGLQGCGVNQFISQTIELSISEYRCIGEWKSVNRINPPLLFMFATRNPWQAVFHSFSSLWVCWLSCWPFA